ncbi:hypothetical protein PAXRUDRAFT_830494 [Paxillus rubicundulus Ve08.2h10]|uniref:HCP-like protein n=1 Tax=Paxillus rubicundulus Ve08.2h10 TaxID=930991 RepID=A0A0D0E3W9_9AGAM|nr:hypothetical protein PAXRUDRAFT_830494 [Paxillus rubicundulus Ve08.2h10]
MASDMEGQMAFEYKSSEGRLLHSSPLETLVRRTSSRRQAAAGQQEISEVVEPRNVPPSLQPRFPPPLPVQTPHATSPPRPFANQHTPGSPLLHSNFRSSTSSAATNTTALHMGRNSKSFLSLADDYEPDDGFFEGNSVTYGQQPPSHTVPATVLTEPVILDYTNFENPMKPLPSPVPTVVVSSPQGNSSSQARGAMRQPIVSASSPRLNFSRPGRPLILSSEEQKRQVLERNSQRARSPRTSPSTIPFTAVTPVTGTYSEQLLTPGPYTPGEQSSRSLQGSFQPSAVSSSSLASPSRVNPPAHPPSLRVGSPSSLYSNSYSFYQIDSVPPSPTSQSFRSPQDRSSGTSKPSPAEPQTPHDYLQLGIRYHESNQLRDSAIYFEKSAKEQGGCGVGMLMWGLTLRHGWGCEKNEKSGFKWLTKAAEAAVEDLEKAKKGFDMKAVKEELVLAIYEVGQCFFQGWGAPKDQKMAVNYYRVAANLGDADAQQDLAFCLANGRGCKKDKKEAAKWYRAAVAQGVSDVGMAWIYKDKYSD